jgi:hypothetical protein
MYIEGSRKGCNGYPMSRTQLEGMGLAILNDVDPNPRNFVASGVVHTGAGQIGCLMRLEPNEEHQVRCVLYSEPSRVKLRIVVLDVDCCVLYSEPSRVKLRVVVVDVDVNSSVFPFHQMWRVTFRCSKPGVAETLSRLVEMQL